MNENSRIVKLEDFFKFDSKEPINRLAYTEADMEYKVKVIKKMQELGMKITVDQAGNICGSISVGKNPIKTIAIGSHTDSVYDGGQYDGPVGVIVALQTAEEIMNKKNCNGNIKVVIYACEESSRFGNACIGSKFLNGNLKTEDFEQIVDQKAKKRGEIITLKSAIEQEKAYLKKNIEGIEEVDKIFDEVDYALETHIEQYEILDKKSKKTGNASIGIIDSVGSALRVKYNAKGKANHTGSTPMKKRSNPVDATAFIGKKVRKLGMKWEKEGQGRASQVEVNTIGHNGSFNQIATEAEGFIDFRLIGENTPKKALEKFDKIIKKVEEKTKTNIEYEVVSKGMPSITSSSLNVELSIICENLNIDYYVMPSYPGQDTGYVPARKKTMIFIPSTEGSHNPKESTTRKAIEDATKVFTGLTERLLQEKLKDKYKLSLDDLNSKESKDELQDIDEDKAIHTKKIKEGR